MPVRSTAAWRHSGRGGRRGPARGPGAAVPGRPAALSISASTSATPISSSSPSASSGWWLGRPRLALAIAAAALAVDAGLAALPRRGRAGLGRAARELRRGRAGHDDRGTAGSSCRRRRRTAIRCAYSCSGCRWPRGTWVYAAAPARPRRRDACARAAQQLSRTGIRASRRTSRVAPPSTISRSRECP